MAEVRHRVGIRGDADQIYQCLIQPDRLSGWWASEASGEPKVGAILRLGFSGLAVLCFSIRVLDAPKTFVMECVDGPGAWLHSELHFDLHDDGEQVSVTLTHRNAAAQDDDFLYFNTKWPLYLLSLRDLIESGSGRPYPRDIKIHVGD